MKENKSEFVKEFQKLISNHTSEYSDITDITYVKTDDGNEWIYVTYESGSQRRINVNCDSCSAIMADFIDKINHAEWVEPDNRITLSNN